MPSTPISEGRLPSKGVPFLVMREFGHLTPSKVVPARPRQQLANAGRYSAAASARSGTFRLVLPLNSAAHSDARASRVLCKGRRARAGGCER
jgi:hypothetical protein